ncbi:TetR/AcrR family transcriptional regulator [Pseudoclavibacter sp. RFBJ3]|uniref:TetR/AcrR family transcriptional regulator n=1 Tax=unclassified Pseudoclavibacter TaxID=2615177 RepID=UPI000CE71E35|nr:MULTISPECIES: TetR/AcrR family transcriptional regulator [unclassified Pseudoclavibacter]PPF79569.1 TetR/AcrR family transcriptional regulator [Pseudoclavibacter sp. RFBJ5]PPF88558.1 TetR/AcrR family transcriptional regulator [Pseudoclavibacter sp. RFBJ3]PPG00424.1 TetR/AcrR family transcriptional regulator [Pseudoclavibacter sp. RFBH5]PPG17338.1 TetR/AcrR family transcriptional regulator [Pseudoclavibacter sp. RFBI4]
MAQQGRPRAFVEREVLDAAMRVFWEHGYEASTVTQLRAATGLSAASLYGAFGSKEGLFERTVEHYVVGPGRVSDLVRDLWIDPVEALDRMLRATIDMQSDPGNPGGCLVTLSATVGAGGEDDVAARAIVAARRTADRAGIEACIRRGIEANTIRADLDPAIMATLIHSFVLGISTQLVDGVSPSELNAAASALIDSVRSRHCSRNEMCGSAAEQRRS